MIVCFDDSRIIFRIVWLNNCFYFCFGCMFDGIWKRKKGVGGEYCFVGLFVSFVNCNFDGVDVVYLVSIYFYECLLLI